MIGVSPQLRRRAALRRAARSRTCPAAAGRAPRSRSCAGAHQLAAPPRRSPRSMISMSLWPSSSVTLSCSAGSSSTTSSCRTRGVGEVLEAIERLLQSVGGHGLGHERERAALQPVLALVLDGEDLHRDVARVAAALELVEHGPAEHVGQEHIERDGRRLDTCAPARGHRRRSRASSTLKPRSRARLSSTRA